MGSFKRADQSLARIERQSAFFTQRVDLCRGTQLRCTDAWLSILVAKPTVFYGNKVELIGCSQQNIKPVLLHDVAESTFRGRTLDEFLVPWLGQIANPLGSDITDVSRVGWIGDRRSEIAQFLFQFVTERRIRTNFSQRLRTIAHEVRYMSEREKHAFNFDPHGCCQFRHLVRPKIENPKY